MLEDCVLNYYKKKNPSLSLAFKAIQKEGAETALTYFNEILQKSEHPEAKYGKAYCLFLLNRSTDLVLTLCEEISSKESFELLEDENASDDEGTDDTYIIVDQSSTETTEKNELPLRVQALHLHALARQEVLAQKIRLLDALAINPDKENKFVQTLAACEEVLKLEQDNFAANLLKMDIFLQKESAFSDKSTLVSLFTKISTLLPPCEEMTKISNAFAAMRDALTAFEKKQFGRAQKNFLAALNFIPSLRCAWCGLFQICMHESTHNAEALQMMELALEKFKHDPLTFEVPCTGPIPAKESGIDLQTLPDLYTAMLRLFLREQADNLTKQVISKSKLATLPQNVQTFWSITFSSLIFKNAYWLELARLNEEQQQLRLQIILKNCLAALITNNAFNFDKITVHYEIVSRSINTAMENFSLQLEKEATQAKNAAQEEQMDNGIIALASSPQEKDEPWEIVGLSNTQNSLTSEQTDFVNQFIGYFKGEYNEALKLPKEKPKNQLLNETPHKKTNSSDNTPAIDEERARYVMFAELAFLIKAGQGLYNNYNEANRRAKYGRLFKLESAPAKMHAQINAFAISLAISFKEQISLLNSPSILVFAEYCSEKVVEYIFSDNGRQRSFVTGGFYKAAAKASAAVKSGLHDINPLFCPITENAVDLPMQFLSGLIYGVSSKDDVSLLRKAQSEQNWTCKGLLLRSALADSSAVYANADTDYPLYGQRTPILPQEIGILKMTEWISPAKYSY